MSLIKENFMKDELLYSSSLSDSELNTTGSIKLYPALISSYRGLTGDAVKYEGRFAI